MAEEGKWITIKGNHILIKTGQTLQEAVEERFGSEKAKLMLSSENFDKEDEDLNFDLDTIEDFPKKKRIYKTIWNEEFDVAEYYNMTDEKLENSVMDILKECEENSENYHQFNTSLNKKLYKEFINDKPIKDAFKDEIKSARDRIKESSFKKYNEYLSKLPKLKDNGIENSYKGTNTKNYEWSLKQPYGTNDRKLYIYNCQRCVIAYELRRRGYDVTADKYDKNDRLEYGDNNLTRCFADYEYGHDINLRYKSYSRDEYGNYHASRKALFKHAEKDMLKEGEGARFIVDWSWKNYNSGHTINAEIKDGKLKFYDAQISKEYDLDYIINDKTIKPGSFHVTRVDDLQLTDRLGGVVQWNH